MRNQFLPSSRSECLNTDDGSLPSHPIVPGVFLEQIVLNFVWTLMKPSPYEQQEAAGRLQQPNQIDVPNPCMQDKQKKTKAKLEGVRPIL